VPIRVTSGHAVEETPWDPQDGAPPGIDVDRGPQPVFVFVHRLKAGATPWHSHRRAQLAYVSEGVLTVRTKQGIWVVPPQRGVWIPSRVSHSLRSSREHTACSIYIEPDLVKLPQGCAVVAVEPLVRELLLAVGDIGSGYREGTPEARLISVVLDRLPTLPIAGLNVPEPSDARVRKMTQALTENPADSRSLSELSQALGMSARTAERLFRSELGITFREWRCNLRLVIALERLGAGDSVTNVAPDLGYEDVSAFIAMFKTALGQTPGQYFRSGALVVETSRQATHTRRKSETVTRIRRTA
jgi:AraC-like DNA-binding protein